MIRSRIIWQNMGCWMVVNMLTCHRAMDIHLRVPFVRKIVIATHYSIMDLNSRQTAFYFLDIFISHINGSFIHREFN